MLRAATAALVCTTPTHRFALLDVPATLPQSTTRRLLAHVLSVSGVSQNLSVEFCATISMDRTFGDCKHVKDQRVRRPDIEL